MVKFFIDRPIFAWVIAIFILLIGGLSITKLPIAQYPNVAPPSIVVNATYPGATAKTLDESVTSLIEQEMNGADGLMYMESQSQSNGQAQITLSFKTGTNPDLAAVDVQNRIKRVEARLPQSVTQQGVQVNKAQSNILLFAMLSSNNGAFTPTALGDYISRNILNDIRRLDGVGQAQLYGSERAMRIWVDPSKLIAFKLASSEIVNAIRSQNAQVTAGTLGELPSNDTQKIYAPIVVAGQLNKVEDFENIVLKANPDGSSVKLKDVARVEIGGQTYATSIRLNGNPSAAIAVQLTPTANALATAKLVHAKMEELSKYFPQGIKYTIPYDTSVFIQISIEEVIKTLFEAIILVFLVMYLFLQNIRYTIIPTIVVPIALMGTLGVMSAFGYSINVLTMFGMVLAIGILVDDAIVVVENVERIMSEEGLSPKEATKKAMGQITGAIIGITLVLVAVFIPMAFFGGAVGSIYRQFTLSMVASMLFSAFLALSLTPALCATFLKPVEAGHHHAKTGFFGGFNRVFLSGANKYQNIIAKMLNKTTRYMIVYALILVCVGLLYQRLPSSFLPSEDQGYIITSIQLPAGASQNRTLEVLKQVEDYYKKDDNVKNIIGVIGRNFSGAGQNAAMVFARFKPWDERGSNNTSTIIAGKASAHFASIKDAFIFAVNPPPIRELGNATGFNFRLQDRGGMGHEALLGARNQLLAMASQSKILKGVRPEGMEDSPQLNLKIDREKANAMGIDFANISGFLSNLIGSSYINDFENQGRQQRVIVQADALQRLQEDDVLKLHIKNKNNDMVPISSFASTNWGLGSVQLNRYNGYPSMNISGEAGAGFSTGDAMAEMEKLASQLPVGFGFEWTGQSLEEKTSGSQASALFILSLLAVFLCLAALYESTSIPIAVLLVVPLGILGALLLTMMRGMPNDVYFKVGLIATIGLSAKNAILIIEFAKELQEKGKGLIEATLEAVHLRFRPILMTSIAFILGVLPLVLAKGAGSSSQQAIGTGVMGGMITATILAVFFVPVFFVVIRKISTKKISKNLNKENINV